MGVSPIPKHRKKATPQPRVIRLHQQEFPYLVDTSSKAKTAFEKRAFHRRI